MCGLCGALSGPRHWSAAAGVLDAARRPWRAEHARLAQRLDRITRRRGIRVGTWSGTSYLVSSPTGAQVMAETLADVWVAVDRMTSRPIDPLSAEWHAAADTPKD